MSENDATDSTIPPPGTDAPVEVSPAVEVTAPEATASVVSEVSTASELGGEPARDEPEPQEVRKHFTAPAMVSLERVDEDLTFLVRSSAELEDVSALATELARLGQLFPIDVRLKRPDRFQIVTGFRRVAALRFLQRERVLARLHIDLSDDDAMLMALASAIHSKSVPPEALTALRDRLLAAGTLPASAREMLEKALSGPTELSPESVEEEVDADELAADVTLRLGQCNQDLALLADVFAELDDARKDELLKQLNYSKQLVEFLEGGS